MISWQTWHQVVVAHAMLKLCDPKCANHTRINYYNDCKQEPSERSTNSPPISFFLPNLPRLYESYCPLSSNDPFMKAFLGVCAQWNFFRSAMYNNKDISQEAHLCLCLMPPASGWPNVMTLAREEWVKLVHSHSWHVEGRDVHVWSVSHPRLGHICCVCATTKEKKFFLNIYTTFKHHNYLD